MPAEAITAQSSKVFLVKPKVKLLSIPQRRLLASVLRDSYASTSGWVTPQTGAELRTAVSLTSRGLLEVSGQDSMQWTDRHMRLTQAGIKLIAEYVSGES